MQAMSHVFSSLETTAKSVALFFSSRSSRCISSSVLRHGRHYASKYRQLYVATPLCRRYSPAPKKKISDPLHILFCGSDEFSCASLQALHDEHVQNPDLIRSIDVVVRPGKRTGRGYKVVRDPPIRSLAESLGLQIHERDTFTGWNMPTKTNLIVAVSFGLFIPPRLLRGAKYGGLNLHPSLLPDLRGPAPLQHTLLSGRSLTGVSLQTLDHTTFDHGVVLSQTSSDPRHESALRIPPSCKTVPDLRALVTPVAATMLLDGLRAGLHVPPLEDRGWKPDADEEEEVAAALVHAPKITKTDRRLSLSLLRICDGETSSSSFSSSPEKTSGGTTTLARRHAAIGPLWFESRDRQGRKKRVIVEALEELPPADVSCMGGPPRMLLLAETPSALLSSSSSSSSSSSTGTTHKQYLIPFEEEEEQEEEEDEEDEARPSQDDGLNTPRQSQKYLVFWNDSSPTKKKQQDELCLGNYRVLSLKVEGDRAKPARLALQNFFILDR
ncbi:Formyltransferase [Xylaria acuta]|nr:Formyltransferase [Xylaria acuta]